MSCPHFGPDTFRHQTGIFESALDREDYKLARSLTMTLDGEADVNKSLDEIFTGFFVDGEFIVDHASFSSTLILNGLSVTIASQVYEAAYLECPDNVARFKDDTTYEAYYKKRAPLSVREKERGRITWMGAPSLLYSYRGRKELAPYLYGSSVINLMFWITSFNSLECVKSYNESNKSKLDMLTKNHVSNYQQILDSDAPTKTDQETLPELVLYHSELYCNKYENIKEKCKTPEYQKYNTYKNFMKNGGTIDPENDKDGGAFLTNFEDCIKRVNEEEEAMKLFHGTTPNLYSDINKTYVQRYNEMFSYTYPWDIEGIEVGAVAQGDLIILMEALNIKRANVIKELEQIAKNRYIYLEKINMIIKTIIEKPNYPTIIYGLIQQSEDETIKITYTLFLVTRLILTSRCNIRDIFKNKKFEFSISEEGDNIINLVKAIIQIMRKPVLFYEYKRVSTGGFQLIKLEKPERTKPLELFEIKVNEYTKIYTTYLSDKQLTGEVKITIKHGSDLADSRELLKLPSLHMEANNDISPSVSQGSNTRRPLPQILFNRFINSTIPQGQRGVQSARVGPHETTHVPTRPFFPRLRGTMQARNRVYPVGGVNTKLKRRITRKNRRKYTRKPRKIHKRKYTRIHRRR